MDAPTATTELLGPLNEIERKFAPPALFSRGARTLLRPGLGRVVIIGSRKASPEGVERTRRVARLRAGRSRRRARRGHRHRAAIDAGGRTIAVLGTPLEQVHPAENAGLHRAIMRDHLCLSQFAPGSVVQKQNFPIRNRTMALVSHVTVIMEARDDSGSLHQGWEALRLGRAMNSDRSILDQPGVTWPQQFSTYGARVPDVEGGREL